MNLSILDRSIRREQKKNRKRANRYRKANGLNSECIVILMPDNRTIKGNVIGKNF